MGEVTRDRSEGEGANAIDPHGLLLRLAFSLEGETDLNAKELTQARAIVGASGGLSYAYRVLEDAAMMRDAFAPDIHATPHAQRRAREGCNDDNALAAILLEDARKEDAAAHARTTPSPLSILSSLRATLDTLRLAIATPKWWLGGTLAAAATAVLLVQALPQEKTLTRSNVAPGVKSISGAHFFLRPFTVVRMSSAGALDDTQVLQALSSAVRDLERCAPSSPPGESEWTLRFTISAEGIAKEVRASNAANATEDRSWNACVVDVVKHTAFPFSKRETRVVVVLRGAAR